MTVFMIVMLMIFAYDTLCFVCTPDNFENKFKYLYPLQGIWLYIKFKHFEMNFGEWETK